MRILRNLIWRREPFTYGEAYLDLLLKAVKASQTVRVREEAVTLERGQMLWLEGRLAEEWQRNRPWVDRLRHWLAEEGMITVDSNHQRTVITLVNYDAHQPFKGATGMGTQVAQDGKGASRLPEIPADAVLAKFFAEFRDEAHGLEGIPEVWWRSWVASRLNARKWPADWQRSATMAFLAEVLAGHPKALARTGSWPEKKCRLAGCPPVSHHAGWESPGADGIRENDMRLIAGERKPSLASNPTEHLAEYRAWPHLVWKAEPEPGIALPFDFPLQLRRGEMTLWTGVTGSGKSTLLDFVTVAALAQGERSLVACFEMPREDSHDKMCCQAFGGRYFDQHRLSQCATESERTAYLAAAREQTLTAHRWLARGLWYYMNMGTGHWRQLMEDMRQAREQHGVSFFVVDNFMRLGIARNDYAQQAECARAFAKLAMELDAHVVVVLHRNKAGHTIGSQLIEVLAHNVVEIQRDALKGRQMWELCEDRRVAERIGNFSAPEFLEKKAALDLKPDAKFILHKQRIGMEDASKHLWFDAPSQQYLEYPPGHKKHAPIRFVANAQSMPPPAGLQPPFEISHNP